ncbi:MAG: GDSL-type esterase/lipase family protein [Planctomycetota bacterium]
MTTDPTRVACVGGSITFGLGLEDRRRDCYPAVLQRLMGPGYLVRNFGYSGAAAGRGANEPYWQTPSFTAACRFTPGVVLLALGTNDAQHANLPVLDDFADEYLALIAHFQALPTAPAVIAVSPPPVFEPLPEIDIPSLDAVVRLAVLQVASSAGLRVVDAYTPLVARPDLFPDNLHPNAAGAQILAEAAAEALRAQAGQ